MICGLEKQRAAMSDGFRGDSYATGRALIPRAFAVLLLLVSFGLALTSAVQKSPTMDEQNHIARGAAYLGTGDPRLSVEHPPLVNVLSALPAHLLLDLRLPLDQWWEAAEWYHFADNFLWRANPHPDRIVFLSRLPIMALGLLLTSLVFRWGQTRFGRWGGLLSAAFCALDPNILAHQRLSTTDLGGTVFAFLAAYAFWRLSRHPVIKRVLAAGLALGLAFAAKLSALILGPILALVFLLDGLLVDRGRGPWLLRRLTILAVTALLALLVVWASYLFGIGPLDGAGVALPAPPYVRGVRAVLDLAGGGRSSYLLGRVGKEGWWYYFPVAFAVKTPLPTLLGLLVATVAMILQTSREDLFIAVPPLAYFLVLTTARLNLGYRHLLPVLPFLALHIGRLAAVSLPWRAQLDMRRTVPLVLTGWLVVTAVAIYPHFLAYFNPIGGGPANGWRILVDSNIDWGQDLIGLQRWMERESVDRVKLSWFGSAPPESYGIEHELLPGLPHGFALWQNPPFDPSAPEPGVYAISVTNLVGVVLPDHDLYAWFLERPPDDRIGYSVFIYRISASR
jgi:4-amino-4-deoxy-L-arabinose transferase-like glycosyltransferase